MNPESSRKRIIIAVVAGLGCVSLLYALLTKSEIRIPLREPEGPRFLVSSGTIQSGDALSLLLAKRGLKADLVFNIERALNKTFKVRNIQPGHTFEVITSTDGVFQKFIYHTGPIQSYLVALNTVGEMVTSEEKQNTVWKEKRVKGEVTENLYKDLLKQGYPESFVANVVADLGDNIFGWRIDFFTEQRPGDKFDILMEQEYKEGSDTPLWNGRGRILVATYTGKATRVKENVAVRFQEPGVKRAEYYDEKGQAVRRAFLRAPFTHGAFRVSSGFNLRRFHPILRTYRPHHGTDYAAGTGTPVAAIGKGTVILAGWNKGYGRCIDIRHNNKYVSRYGHLSKIAVRPGQTVEQGQFIGRVGSTGLSTGPHLHFELLVDGVQRNFLTMSFPSASAVAEKNMPAFRAFRDQILARFNGTEATNPVNKS